MLKYCLILICILLTAITVTACGKQKEKELKTLIQEGAVLVDVRTPEEFAGGNVSGSINIPLSELYNHIEQLKEENKPIILFCKSGNRAGKGIKILEANGITNATNGGTWKDILGLLEKK